MRSIEISHSIITAFTFWLWWRGANPAVRARSRVATIPDQWVVVVAVVVAALAVPAS
jgi:hypothetical protein